MKSFELKPIGIVRTPFQDLKNMPIQPGGASGVRGTLEIFSEFQEGLKDVELFSHLFLLYRFHRAVRTSLEVIPFLDSEKRGVYATRSPLRPNHIGLSVVHLLERKENILDIENVDILDGTPLLDIKPYVLQFDGVENPSSGWITANSHEVAAKRSDERFL